MIYIYIFKSPPLVRQQCPATATTEWETRRTFTGEKNTTGTSPFFDSHFLFVEVTLLRTHVTGDVTPWFDPRGPAVNKAVEKQDDVKFQESYCEVKLAKRLWLYSRIMAVMRAGGWSPLLGHAPLGGCIISWLAWLYLISRGKNIFRVGKWQHAVLYISLLCVFKQLSNRANLIFTKWLFISIEKDHFICTLECWHITYLCKYNFILTEGIWELVLGVTLPSPYDSCKRLQQNPVSHSPGRSGN